MAGAKEIDQGTLPGTRRYVPQKICQKQNFRMLSKFLLLTGG
jgi:hypothetical protein